MTTLIQKLGSVPGRRYKRGTPTTYAAFDLTTIPGYSTLLTKIQAATGGYWKLDEASGNRLDSSGNGHTLVEEGGTVTSSAARLQGGHNAAYFQNDGHLLSSTDAWFKLYDGDFFLAITATGQAVGCILSRYHGAGADLQLNAFDGNTYVSDGVSYNMQLTVIQQQMQCFQIRYTKATDTLEGRTSYGSWVSRTSNPASSTASPFRIGGYIVGGTTYGTWTGWAKDLVIVKAAVTDTEADAYINCIGRGRHIGS